VLRQLSWLTFFSFLALSFGGCSGVAEKATIVKVRNSVEPHVPTVKKVTELTAQPAATVEESNGSSSRNRVANRWQWERYYTRSEPINATPYEQILDLIGKRGGTYLAASERLRIETSPEWGGGIWSVRFRDSGGWSPNLISPTPPEGFQLTLWGMDDELRELGDACCEALNPTQMGGVCAAGEACSAQYGFVCSSPGCTNRWGGAELLGPISYPDNSLALRWEGIRIPNFWHDPPVMGDERRGDQALVLRATVTAEYRVGGNVVMASYKWKWDEDVDQEIRQKEWVGSVAAWLEPSWITDLDDDNYRIMRYDIDEGWNSPVSGFREWPRLSWFTPLSSSSRRVGTCEIMGVPDCMKETDEPRNPREMFKPPVLGASASARSAATSSTKRGETELGWGPSQYRWSDTNGQKQDHLIVFSNESGSRAFGLLDMSDREHGQEAFLTFCSGQRWPSAPGQECRDFPSETSPGPGDRVIPSFFGNYKEGEWIRTAILFGTVGEIWNNAEFMRKNPGQLPVEVSAVHEANSLRAGSCPVTHVLPTSDGQKAVCVRDGWPRNKVFDYGPGAFEGPNDNGTPTPDPPPPPPVPSCVCFSGMCFDSPAVADLTSCRNNSDCGC